jgi:predicted AlkP superfamily pyrophosphatase or phosphodiesterase
MRIWFLLLLSLLAANAGAAERPDLVVVISVDQLPSEYLSRFDPWFSKGGFRRFLRNGAAYPNAAYGFATMKTAPGHASISTGMPPSRHGIVNNTWFDRTTGSAVYAAADPQVTLSEGEGATVSPANLQVDTIGDRLKQAWPRSVVIGVSDKDRSAILMAGRRADGAYWFDEKIERFVTSSYYAADKRILDFNGVLKPFFGARTVWSESGLIPEKDLQRITFDEPEVHAYKTDTNGLGVAFPHPIGSAAALMQTPYGNDLILDFAQHVIVTRSMGLDDDTPDMIFIGLSATDEIGHSHGPDSREIADTMVRLDRALERFLDWLDTRSNANIAVALTSDHGIQPIPEIEARKNGAKGGRVTFRRVTSAKTIGESSPRRRDLELGVAKKLGLPLTGDSPVAEAVIASVETPHFYLNWDRIDASKIDPATARKALRDELMKFGEVAAAFTSDQLLAVNSKASRIETAARLSFDAERSGDVLAYLKPGWVFTARSQGTDHGQPVEDDQNVPLLFWGDSIATVHSKTARVSPLDLVPVLASLLGISAGDPAAKPLPITK